MLVSLAKEWYVKRTKVFILVAVVMSAVVQTGASDVGYPGGGIRWLTSPDGSNVGDCFGNCGAGCGDAWNPCGGRSQFWELQIVSDPDEISLPLVQCNGAAMVLAHYRGYSAVGQWTYRGHSAFGCAIHDYFCGPESGYVGCVLFAGCGSEFDEDWSYTENISGTTDELQGYEVLDPYHYSCVYNGYP